jgi:hypothetical protein
MKVLSIFKDVYIDIYVYVYVYICLKLEVDNRRDCSAILKFLTNNTITVVIITVKDIITIDIKDKAQDIIINKKFITTRASK